MAARLLGYWRDCAADEAAALAAAERAGAAPELELDAVAAGQISVEIASALFAHGAGARIPVMVAVGRLAPKRRAAAPDRSETLAPLWIPALLTQAGELQPDAQRRPFLARAALEPTLAAATIGRLDDAAEFYAREHAALDAWGATWTYAMALWEAVAKEPFANYVPYAWRFEPIARIVGRESGGLPDPQLALLEGARERLASGNALSLVERFATSSASPSEALATQRGQLGAEPLCDDQRLALRRALALREGDALAVPAAPGTGAVALVESLVASLVVDAVARAAGPFDAVPPLIAIATPTSEGAAAWLEAFACNDHAPSGRRWIAQAGGYALHLEAGGREDSPVDRGYPALRGNAAAWQASAVADLADPADRERAFLEAFAQSYGRVAPSLDDAIAYLHVATRAWTARLETDARAGESGGQSESAGVDRAAVRARLAAPHDAAVSAAAAELEALDETRARESEETAGALERLNAAVAALEPRGWYESAFSWLANVAHRRRRRFAAALGVAPPAERKTPEALRAWSEERRAAERARAIRALSDRDAVAERLERANQERATALQAFDETAAAWDALGELAASLGMDPAQLATEADSADELFDRVHRREAFRCAARYWEGRRLRELTQPHAAAHTNAAAGPIVRELRSVAMLYPVAVATLPALAAWYATAGNENGPLFGALDALVVVDAGQVDVARGAAALPPARRLIALGDPYGRDPMVQLEEARSREYLRERFGDLDSWTQLDERGLLSYDRGAASLLRALPARVALTTQRDRAPAIVACCDELAYHGLRAVREAATRGSLPALGYAHVRGRGEARGASRVSEPEARNVVQFVIERREELMRAYPEAKCLADILAIQSPFEAQAASIAERLAAALRACRMRAEPDLAVGTPFASGNAVPVVLYSHVVEPGEDYTPFDARPNLPALALWGATDHFLFFGDVHGLASRMPGSPSSVLAKHLLATAANRLEGLPTSFYGPDAELMQVDTQAAHLAFLDEALAGATEQVLIVSPLAERDLSSEATLQRLAELAQRGVRVSIFTDRRSADGGAASAGAGVIEWHVLDTILASALAIDRYALYEGSFAWLGASADPGTTHTGRGWLARGPDAAAAVDELYRYYEHR
jgi:hypothetical protein